MAKVILFDVEHGFCAFIRSDTGCTLMIDCGKATNFSPVEYILASELYGASTHSGYRLTELIITHPHDDHIEDIARVIYKMEPWLLLRQQYNWSEIKIPGAKASDYVNLDAYSSWQSKFVPGQFSPVNWGMTIQTFALSPDEAKVLDSAKFVNNSSYVTVVTFRGTLCQEKFLFGGDMEKLGWSALLARNASFRTAVKDVDFFVVPHHGHSSGFSTELFTAMGRNPILNLISVTSRDEHVESRYSSVDYAIGSGPVAGKRYSLSTRADGTIIVSIDSEGKYLVTTTRLPPNLGLPPPPRPW